MPEEHIPIDKLTRLQLIELDTCSRCGHCADFCPTYIEKEGRQSGLIPGNKAKALSKLVKKQKSIWSLLRKSKPATDEEIAKIAGNLYTCTLCGRCQVVCPFSIQTEHLWRTFRSILCESGQHPEIFKLMNSGIQEKSNPYGANADLRTMWSEFVDSSDVPMKEQAEVVYFVGCTSSLKAQVEGIPYAISRVLNHAKEDWTLLGDKERCCGSPSMMVGNWEAAKEFARYNADLIESAGAKTVVTGCPGCYRALKKYPELLERELGFEVLHTAELFHRYLMEGRLSITEKSSQKIAYHDPCELGRLSGITEEPREILGEITSDLIELSESRLESRCCGGGGLLQALDGDLRLKIAKHRVKQAEEAGAEILVSACPACKMALDDAIRSESSKLKMVDLTELVAQKLKG